MLYHASPTGGLTVLTPHVSNHGHPLVYFSNKRENVLVYLSNAVENTAATPALSTRAGGKNGGLTAST